MTSIFQLSKRVKEERIIPRQYQMDVVFLCELRDLGSQGKEGVLDAVIAAFRYGFLMGNHCTVNRKMKKLKIT